MTRESGGLSGASGAGGAAGRHPPGADRRDLLPRDFGRDGVSGLLTADRAMRARDVSRPTAEDDALAQDVLSELLARVDGRRPESASRREARPTSLGRHDRGP